MLYIPTPHTAFSCSLVVVSLSTFQMSGQVAVCGALQVWAKSFLRPPTKTSLQLTLEILQLVYTVWNPAPSAVEWYFHAKWFKILEHTCIYFFFYFFKFIAIHPGLSACAFTKPVFSLWQGFMILTWINLGCVALLCNELLSQILSISPSYSLFLMLLNVFSFFLSAFSSSSK